MLEPFGNYLVTSPLWAIAFLIFGGMFVMLYVGRLLRQRHKRQASPDGREGEEKESSQESFMVSSVMGLLALLIGFSFSLAVDRFETRRQNVLEEANAIGTTYLRSQLLEEPHRARLSKLLADYTDVRIALATSRPGPAVQPLLTSNDRLIVDLWTATVAAFPSMKPYDFSSSYLETMNAMIDMDATRKAGRQAHVPSEVFLVLLIYLFVAAGAISYMLVGQRGRETAIFLFVLFGIVLLLVIDIDRPTTGGIAESQLPMTQLRDFIRTQPPVSFDRFNVPGTLSSPTR
ncbi:hypothetical protein ACFB49_22850 [Sphingomonas sp. DBB INV C78]|uniref:bestrophin-like domain n=1 Tax=Sphingomonas sp. DBB INV C78 TaxID=3349434 RepID=UPI0036D20B00